MTFYDSKLFLPTHFYGVEVDSAGQITHTDMVHLIYQIPSYKDVSPPRTKD